MTQNVPITMAFGAGLISFLSPCVLPLIPGYISFISGVSLQEMKDGSPGNGLLNRQKLSVILNSIFFIGGFSAIFILLGASATWLGTLLSTKISFLTKIAGLFIIFFGVFKMGLIRPLFFFKEAKFNVENKKLGFIWAMIIGASFAFGWTPCIGPILTGILAFAGTLEHVKQGILLLSVYSLGLGIPFLLTAFGVNQFFRFFNRIKRHLGLLEKITGGIMILLGLLIFFDKLILIPGYLPFLNKFAL
ncbi:MAG: cytochrome c biogenesis protein CcdA [Deltaproteobacteria bacterium]|nr:cytochrome c biogenesis protein CcdA [Deltaproteobacteria bacterium]MBW2671071.1 cytochrome c biogenesis protein CcdA [Deltaproteobacteria bacterium]